LNKEALQQFIESADRAYAARAEIQNIQESVGLLRNALRDFDDYAIAWRLSRALFFLGQESTTAGIHAISPSSRRKLHAEGVNAGRRATLLRSELVEGHFWAGVNLALLAALERGLKAATHAWLAKRALQRAITIDAAYHSAGPLRVLARLQHKLPRWLGGGVAQARANFERAIDIAPANTVTRIYLAELLSAAGETTRAREQLERLLSAPFDPDWAFETERDRALAKEILMKLTMPSAVARG
jgi:tetratricopeptide (TPR) repeat protein